jgi:hypothetical protein
MNEAHTKKEQAPRVWFRIEEAEISWLPVGEAAFLLWVLAILVALWVGAAAVLGLL